MILGSNNPRVGRMVLILALLVCFLASHRALADDLSVHVEGAGIKSSDWTADRLKTELAGEVKPIEFTAKGQKHTANAVAVVSVLKAAGFDLSLKMNRDADPKTKNRLLRLAVVVRGSDGYTTTMSLAELLPEIGNRHAWLAVDTDNQPLPQREAPAHLILPDDALPGRWVRGVATITVVDPTESSASQPTP